MWYYFSLFSVLFIFCIQNFLGMVISWNFFAYTHFFFNFCDYNVIKFFPSLSSPQSFPFILPSSFLKFMASFFISYYCINTRMVTHINIPKYDMLTPCNVIYTYITFLEFCKFKIYKKIKFETLIYSGLIFVKTVN